MSIEGFPQSRIEGEDEERILENIRFTIEQSKDRKTTFYVSSAPGRKRITLSPNSPKPIEGQSYRVIVVEDTDPEDPTLGQYVVRIEEGQPRQLTEQEWKTAEGNVDEAEGNLRRAQSASVELYDRTDTPKLERLEKQLPTDLPSKDKIVERATYLEDHLTGTAGILLSSEDSPERALVKFRKENLTAALRSQADLEHEREMLLTEEADILKSGGDVPRGATLGVLNDIRQQLKGNAERQEKLLTSDPEAWYGLHLSELKEYKEESRKGRIIETPYVKQNAEDIYAHLRGNKPVLIYGHLGTGKTELAMHVAREYVGKEALVISGSKDMSLAELYGHQVLKLDSISEDMLSDFTEQVEGKFTAWAEKKYNATEAEKDRMHETILQAYLTQLQKGTVSDFFMGPIYRAMEEGRPVIIDEVNAIPHELLISLNYIATRRPGDEVSVQQDSGRTVTVQEGFGIIMTANLNQGQNVYVDRQELDPAFLSRLHKIEHDYLPQATEGDMGDESSKKNELFHVMLAKLMDKRGNMEIPEGSFADIWRLAQVARITQDVFAGREVNSANYLQVPGAALPIQYFLKESVLSMRAMESVLGQWQGEGYKYELDYYVWNEFIGQSTQPSDRAYLYQLFQKRFGFFTADGWPQNPDTTPGGLRGFAVQAPKNPATWTETKTPREVIDAAFGKGPERANWPLTPTS
jgi:MoxR-like ATPase